MTTDRTTQYALDVLADKIVAGDLVKAACQRHIDDMKAAEAAPYRYYFDVEEAERIIDFAETLTIAEGEEEQPVTAYPFQCFILGSLNGWRTVKKERPLLRNGAGTAESKRMDCKGGINRSR